MKRDVAIVALINEKQEIFLVRTRAYPTAWQPVGGGIDAVDRSPEEAVIREAKEEVGLFLHNVEKVFVVPFDFGEGDVHCFIARVSNDVVMNVNTQEIAEFGWFSTYDATNLPVYPATQAFLRKIESLLM